MRKVPPEVKTHNFDTGERYEAANFIPIELVRAALNVADYKLKLPEVWAMAHPDNIGSRRVLEKAGFIVVRHLVERNRFLLRRPRVST